MSEVLVTMHHIRKSGLCSRGARLFCKRWGGDWNDFLINGVSVEILEKTGDAMAIKLAKLARGE